MRQLPKQLAKPMPMANERASGSDRRGIKGNNQLDAPEPKHRFMRGNQAIISLIESGLLMLLTAYLIVRGRAIFCHRHFRRL